jgi:type I restriction enzyme M protein
VPERTRSSHDARKNAVDERDKVDLGIFWLKDDSLEDSANLPAPDVIAAEIAEDLEAALDQFSQIAADLKK